MKRNASSVRRTRRTMAVALAMLALAACKPDQPERMVGTLERDRVEIAVEASEPITEIAVADGQRVEAGELLLRQDDTRHTARLAQAEAQRDQAAARLAELRRGPREESIREAQAQLAAADARTRNARADLEREQEIFDRGLGNQAALDRAQAERDSARASEQAIRERLDSLLHGTTAEELQQADAALAAAEAAAAQARLDLDRLTIRAPVAGIVDKVWFELGERPAPGTAVAVILDDARVYARLYVPEYLKTRIRPGDTLRVRIDGRDDALTGTVSWVSSDATFTPYFALTEHDRSRLSYLAEVDLAGAAELPSGLPLDAWPQ